MFVNCENQAEVDDLWSKLIADGGEESMCGWLKDKYGLSWQIIPSALGELMGDPDPERSQRVMKAMLQMKKIIVEDLKRAHEASNPMSDLPKIGAPAQRALQSIGITQLKQLTKVTEAEVSRLHGMGPNALGRLREALKVQWFVFCQRKCLRKSN